jgi:NAD(P)-dependent dehydrogenase (short-subunit alcohol dehydrogenase family)
MKRAAIIGASGAIGGAFIRLIASKAGVEQVFAFSRFGANFDSAIVKSGFIDLLDEASIAAAAETAAIDGPLDLVIVAAGMLHEDGLAPEKSLRDLSADKFARAFAINAAGPALAAKHFIPKLRRGERAVFAALSARVGSISDNRLGGWYAYRASKAALNMILKNAAIEAARRAPHAIVAGLHPGTVESALSRPFQDNVSPGRLFSPEDAAARLLDVLERLEPKDSGKCFSYDGAEILP